MKVLFVANSRKPDDPLAGASTRYRCWYRVEDLRELGHQAWLTTFDRLDVRVLRNFDYVIFQRPEYSQKLGKCLRILEQQGIPCAADFDDLIFDPDCWNESPAYMSGRSSRTTVIKMHEAYQRALRSFDLVILSTQPLADAAKSCHPGAGVIIARNGLGPSWFAAKDVAMNEKPSISYFSGNPSHDHDFAMAAPALAAALRENAELELHVYGYLNFDSAAFEEGRVIRHPYTHFTKLPELMGRHTLTIAPLVPNRFNNCKSAVKYLEAVSVGVPCVVSPMEDYNRFKGSHGAIIVAGEGWSEGIQGALEFGLDQANREALATYASEHCRSRGETEKLLRELLSLKAASGKPMATGIIISEMKRGFVEYEDGAGKATGSRESFVSLTRRRLRKLKRDPAAFARDSRLNPINWISAVKTWFK